MSMKKGREVTILESCLCEIIKSGEIPKHVAVIMDGNRRFSKKTNVEIHIGHSLGWSKLQEMIRWCLRLGISNLTAYAFSIENFKRHEEEVNKLMELATNKLHDILNNKSEVMDMQLQFRIWGKTSMLREDLQKVMALTVMMTRGNTKLNVNFAFVYTSRDEIAMAMKDIIQGLKDKQIDIGDIDEDLLSKCLYSNDIPEPEVLIRTSGEVRFSDFLLWQASNTYMYFTETLWPEFTLIEFCKCIFLFQHHYKQLLTIKKAQEQSQNRCSCLKNESRIKKFVNNLIATRMNTFFQKI